MSEKLEPPEPRPLQDEDLIPTGKIIAGLVATIALTVACLVWVWAVMKPFERADRGGAADTRRPDLGVRPHEIGGPTPVDRTLYNEGAGWSAALHDKKRDKLAGWGWVDRKAETVRVPIDRAMDMVVEENRR